MLLSPMEADVMTVTSFIYIQASLGGASQTCYLQRGASDTWASVASVYPGRLWRIFMFEKSW